MKTLRAISVLLMSIGVAFFCGCAPSRPYGSFTIPQGVAPQRTVQTVNWSYETQPVSNKYFDATITPADQLGDLGYTAFRLEIKNKTTMDIEVDWTKTAYIADGTTNGGFMFEGVVYKDRNLPKPPDVVFAKSSFTKLILPSNLVSFSSGGRYSRAAWINYPFPPGENGVYLVVNIGKETVKEKLTATIIKQ